MEAAVAGVKIIGPGDGAEVFLGSIGVRFMIDGSEAENRFSLVEHPMSARALAAPLHLHTREDEYSFVLEGRMGALLGDDVVEAGPGDLVFKPRNQWHTFWNAGDEPCRDRKSTRLNSSHVAISYAVFCLKKKKTTNYQFCLNKKKNIEKKKNTTIKKA